MRLSLREQGGRSHTATHDLPGNLLQSTQTPAAPSPKAGDAVIPHPKAGEVLRQHFPTQRSGPLETRQICKDTGERSRRAEGREEISPVVLRFAGTEVVLGVKQQVGASSHYMLRPSHPLVLPRVSHSQFFLLFSTLPNICFVNNNRHIYLQR